jgi:HSP20 family protein
MVQYIGSVDSCSYIALRPEIAGEMEPMIDLVSTDKEVKLTVEMPGISKENIRIDAFDSTVEVKSEDPQRKYHKTIDLPEEADIETAKSKYNMAFLLRKRKMQEC